MLSRTEIQALCKKEGRPTILVEVAKQRIGTIIRARAGSLFYFFVITNPNRHLVQVTKCNRNGQSITSFEGTEGNDERELNTSVMQLRFPIRHGRTSTPAIDELMIMM